MGKHPGGAPRKPFDWGLLESLAILEAELKYVAERMLLAEGTDPCKRTLESKMKFINRRIRERFDLSYVQYVEEKREPKRIKLRQMMWKTAEKGSAVMQIFLAKNMLGYSDNRNQLTLPDTDNAKSMTLSYKIEKSE